MRSRGARLHPLTALTAAACTAVITTAAASWPLSIAVALAAAVLAVRSGAARQVLAAAAVILVPLWLSLLVLHGLFFPEGRTVLAQWGPARVTAEGLGFALEVGTRTTACVLVLLLFSFTVSVPDLLAALAARNIPPQFGFVVASTLTLLPAVARRLDRIRQAQETRGMVVRGGLLARLGALRLQMVPLVLALMDDAGSRAQALEARGFGSPGPRTSYRDVADPPVQRGLRVGGTRAHGGSRRRPDRRLLAGRRSGMTAAGGHGSPGPARRVHVPRREHARVVRCGGFGSARFLDRRPGRSGSGKSTLGKLLAGWLRAGHAGQLRGSLELDGTRLDFRGLPEDPRINPAEWSRRVAFVPQDAAAMLSTVRATVAEELAFGLENRAVPREDMLRAVERTAARTGLTGLLDRDPATLSGGELRRLAVACAVIAEPDILILDEPLASLDAAGAAQIRGPGPRSLWRRRRPASSC